MNRLTVLITLLVLAALACTFSPSSNQPGDDDDADLTAVPTRINAVATMTPFATHTPTLTPTAQPTARPVATATPIVVANPCTPRTDWPLVTVVAGDTLARIARRVNSTPSALATANCLDNPNLLRVGQALRVPQVPPPPTQPPAPIPAPPVFYNAPTPDRYIPVNGIGVVTTPSVRVTIGVGRAQYVRFYRRSLGTGESVYVGQDTYLADGASVYYSFPLAGRYDLYAIAGNGYTEVQSSVFLLTYNPDFQQPGDPPTTGEGGPVVEPHLSFEGHYTVEAGARVNLTWPGAPSNAQRIEFLLAPTGTGTADGAVVIASDLYPNDGIPATWEVPENGIWAHLNAKAYLPDGRAVESQTVNVYAEAPPDDDNDDPPTTGEGAPVVAPYLSFEGHYTVEAGTTVNLTWPGAPSNALRIDFLMTPTGTGTADGAVVIATDDNPTDGTPTTWEVPENGIWAHLSARAHLPNGRSVESLTVNVYAEG